MKKTRKIFLFKFVFWALLTAVQMPEILWAESDPSGNQNVKHEINPRGDEPKRDAGETGEKKTDASNISNPPEKTVKIETEPPVNKGLPEPKEEPKKPDKNKTTGTLVAFLFGFTSLISSGFAIYFWHKTKKKLEPEMDSLKKDLNDKTAQLEEIEKENQARAEGIKKSRVEIERLQKIEEERKNQISAVEKERHAAQKELTVANTELAKIRQTNASLNGELQRIKDEQTDLLGVSNDVERKKGDLQKLKKEIEDKRKEIAELDSELRPLKQEKSGIEGEVDAAKRTLQEAARIKKEMQENEAAKAELERELAEARSQNESLEKDISSKRHQLEILQQQIGDLEPKLGNARAEFERVERKRQETEAASLKKWDELTREREELEKIKKQNSDERVKLDRDRATCQQEMRKLEQDQATLANDQQRLSETQNRLAEEKKEMGDEKARHQMQVQAEDARLKIFEGESKRRLENAVILDKNSNERDAQSRQRLEETDNKMSQVRVKEAEIETRESDLNEREKRILAVICRDLPAEMNPNIKEYLATEVEKNGDTLEGLVHGLLTVAKRLKTSPPLIDPAEAEEFCLRLFRNIGDVVFKWLGTTFQGPDLVREFSVTAKSLEGNYAGVAVELRVPKIGENTNSEWMIFSGIQRVGGIHSWAVLLNGKARWRAVVK